MEVLGRETEMGFHVKTVETTTATTLYFQTQLSLGNWPGTHLLSGGKHDLPVLGDGPVVLRDLVVLGCVRVKVVLQERTCRGGGKGGRGTGRGTAEILDSATKFSLLVSTHFYGRRREEGPK